MQLLGIVTCPHCGVDLIRRRTRFRWYSRVRMYAAGTDLFWRCPDCRGSWLRWCDCQPRWGHDH